LTHQVQVQVHCPAIELGFSSDKITRSDNFRKKKVSDIDVLGVRADAKSVLKVMCKTFHGP